jgi:hypothetical protein
MFIAVAAPKVFALLQERHVTAFESQKPTRRPSLIKGELNNATEQTWHSYWSAKI